MQFTFFTSIGMWYYMRVIVTSSRVTFWKRVLRMVTLQLYSWFSSVYCGLRMFQGRMEHPVDEVKG